MFVLLARKHVEFADKQKQKAYKRHLYKRDKPYFLKKINDRIGNVEKRLNSLEFLEKKVEKFELEVTKIWNYLTDQNTKCSERLTNVEDKAESTDFNLGIVNSKVEELQSKNKQLTEDLAYVQSQSMRNNLIFGNIEEARQGVNENTEDLLREFLVDKMNIAKEFVEQMKFERVHRMGDKGRGDRKIVAKFTLFKDRELVRKSWKSLDKSKYFVHEQFPKSVVDKRKKLMPMVKEARRNGHSAWIAYDILYIDGKSQRGVANPLFCKSVEKNNTGSFSDNRLTNRNKEWFDYECIQARQRYTDALHVFNRCKTEVNREELFLLKGRYKNDMVILGNSVKEINESLKLLNVYCKKWSLEVNVEKTKVMVFRKRGGILHNEEFLYNGTTPPKLQVGQTETKVYVPPIAANSKVGFKETVAAVDEESSTCRLTVIREGMYGTLEVSWQSGFPEGRVPVDFTEGTMVPDSSSIKIPHGIDEKNFTVSLTATWDVPELFAVHLPVAPSTTVAGGSRLLQDRTQVNIEPYGLLRFADNSTNPSVSEMFGKIYLQVLRLYGSRGKVEARYRVEGISAVPEFDFNTIENHAVAMEPGQTSALIMIEILQDNRPEQEEIFHVNLTDVEKFPTDTTPSISPRISYIHQSSVVKIEESNDPYGVLHIEPTYITVEERFQQVNLTIKRTGLVNEDNTGGIFGTVSVVVRTVGGGESWTSQINPKEGDGNDTIREILYNRDKFTSALSSEDYVVLDTSVTFQQGETDKFVEVTILADDLAEPDQTVLVYLTQPTGGARIAAGEVDGGRKGFAVITIARNDLSSGMIGFASDSLQVTANEDAGQPATLRLVRSLAIYGQIEITWKAKVSAESTEPEDALLGRQLETTSGTATCPPLQKHCLFNVTLIDDEEPEEEETFVVQLVSVLNDAKLDPDASIATVTMEASDYVRGLIEFTDDSRDVVVSSLKSSVRLGVRRVKGSKYRVEVSYRTRQMTRQEFINGVTVSPANEGQDYVQQSGELVFEPERQEIKFIDINLTPFLASQTGYPKQFYIELGGPSNGASVNPQASKAFILITEPKDLDIWEIIKDAEDKPLNDENIRDIIDKLDDVINTSEQVTEDQMSLTEKILEDIVEEGLKRKLPTQLIGQLINLLCKLLSPDKNDATRGRSELATIMENVAYMLITEADCPSPDPPKLHTKQCPHASIAAGRWPLGKIKGYQYAGQRQDEFVIPKDLPNVPDNRDTECEDFHMIEYSSEQWFQRGPKKELLSNKVISFGLKGRDSQYTDFPVVYRIHSPDRRIASSRAKCVYYDMGLNQWVDLSDICQVTNDLDLGVDDFVDCSCKHLTHYAVKATTSDRGLVGYSVWFFVSCFICMTGLLAAILAHHICSVSAMFSASLLMHMCFAAMATQICYVVAAYLSPDEIIVYTIGEDNYRCIVMGLFLHYFFLCQFSWMMTQVCIISISFLARLFIE
ncbi:adhesion G-protein coupled receptor V1-like [Mercenaria mercenaria]|uniref:adhesion G-protein coupled receptor V1-like n=1 Tax=Mercenaria mercenaria TaxID=6596 RepID=UPI00234FAD5F|nr:adhesion G-protein coupled receptor V1-like [Mercenaria mercenaria]